MLIKETHVDVASSANGKDSTMRTHLPLALSVSRSRSVRNLSLPPGNTRPSRRVRLRSLLRLFQLISLTLSLPFSRFPGVCLFSEIYQGNLALPRLVCPREQT